MIETSEKFEFFWYGPFSQWYTSNFVAHGIRFCSAEQYMMWFKDQVFGGVLEQQILAETDPKNVKSLGRSIKGFDADTWNAVAKAGVFIGSMAKYSQNPSLSHLLCATTGTLVEASPYDKIWGIGLAEDNPLALNRKTWNGANWLGEVLTDTRSVLWLGKRTNILCQMLAHDLKSKQAAQFAQEFYEHCMWLVHVAQRAGFPCSL